MTLTPGQHRSRRLFKVIGLMLIDWCYGNEGKKCFVSFCQTAMGDPRYQRTKRDNFRG